MTHNIPYKMNEPACHGSTAAANTPISKGPVALLMLPPSMLTPFVVAVHDGGTDRLMATEILENTIKLATLLAANTKQRNTKTGHDKSSFDAEFCCQYTITGNNMYMGAAQNAPTRKVPINP